MTTLSSSISIVLDVKGLDIQLKGINLYGSYVDRRPLWESLGDFGVFDFDFILLGGDLNLTLSLREVWGSHLNQDPLDAFFNHLIPHLSEK
jgi:hypothetical protein